MNYESSPVHVGRPEDSVAPGQYPVVINAFRRGETGKDLPTRILSIPEARELIADLEAVIEEVESRGFVQVKVPGRSGTFTYRDPSASLSVGDAVQVPFGYRDELRFGTVVGLGRGGYRGYTKDVVSRLVSEPLAA